jgi:hypothetical protein
MLRHLHDPLAQSGCQQIKVFCFFFKKEERLFFSVEKKQKTLPLLRGCRGEPGFLGCAVRTVGVG